MKKVRRAARELALNILYQWDACGMPLEEAVETAMEFADLNALDSKNSQKSDEARAYARYLIAGVKENNKYLDKVISRLAQGWSLDRQPVVDRNILRIAIFEMKFVDSVPPVVAVDEAVEMAKKYSTAESGKFINGVLAGYLREQESGEAGAKFNRENTKGRKHEKEPFADGD